MIPRDQRPRRVILLPTFENLLELLRAEWRCGPNLQDKQFFRLECKCEFEPFGKASETWELVWRLELPTCQYYWKTTEGYRKGGEGLHPTFVGKNLSEALQRAIHFLQECPESMEAGT